MTDRTAPFAALRQSPLSSVNAHTAQNITHHVSIPGLTRRDGSPLVVEKTFTVHEVAEDWVSFIVDFEFDSDPVVYGNHPCAVGPLREVLPASYELPSYPSDVFVAQLKLRRMLQQQALGGSLVCGDVDGRTLEYHPIITAVDSHEQRNRALTALIREYVPFQADVWYDDAHDVIRIRPTRNEVKHVVRTS